VAWAGYRDEQVTLTGDTLRSFVSSPGVSRMFCSACGSPVAFRGERWPGETHLPICAFDAPETMAPTGDHFSEERLPWAPRLA
jgi:hypothetical protein